MGRQGLQEGDHLPGQVRQAGGQGSAANFPFWPGGFDPPQVQGVVWWWWRGVVWCGVVLVVVVRW